VPTLSVVTICITWHVFLTTHAAQESYKCLRLPLLRQLYAAHQIRQLKTAAVCAGRTRHLAQQLQAPFEWQPMTVHVVDSPAHLATLGLAPIHDKSASGATLNLPCTAAGIFQGVLLLTHAIAYAWILFGMPLHGHHGCEFTLVCNCLIGTHVTHTVLVCL